jgi:hypothetical protein
LTDTGKRIAVTKSDGDPTKDWSAVQLRGRSRVGTT